MKTEIATKWADALESGEYEQGRLTLERTLEDGSAKYCCLGVLCELAIADGVYVQKLSRPYVEPGDSHALYGVERESVSLPEEVMRWSGVQTKQAFVPGAHTLLAQNDRGTPFSEIAKIIRANADTI